MYYDNCMALNFKKEKSIQKRGFENVVGIDEAGRGPLAGPVVAGAVLIKDYKNVKSLLKEVNDSKKISLKTREELFKILINNKSVDWGVGIVSNKIIDKINILNATKLAMRKAVKDLNSKLKKENKIIDYLIIDGNFKINADIKEESIIKGDEKVLSCASASIIAKVYRDNLMVKFCKKYNNYGLEKNKGYGTKYHIEQIKKFGYSEIHRKTFVIHKFT